MSTEASQIPTGSAAARSAARATLSLLITAVIAAQCWYAINPQPGPITRAVVRADDSFMSAWVVLLGVAVVGLYVMVRFVVGSAIPLRGRGRAQTLLGAAATVALAAGTLAGFPAEAAAAAVLLAVASTWVPTKGAPG